MSGKCVQISTVKIASPIGPYIGLLCPLGLHELHLDKTVTNDNFTEFGVKSVQLLNSSKNNQHVDQLVQWLKTYFEDKKSPENSVQICPEIAHIEIGNFRQKVWLTLKTEVTFGKTISYGELASLSGNPGAAQAVGSAMANNPISLIIPCHRVIKSDGSYGNYSKATKNDVKAWLLNHEKG